MEIGVSGAQADPSTESSWQEHNGSLGIWLKTSMLEVFVALEPVFRVLSIKHPDHTSLMADPACSQPGIRLAIMEPEQIAESFEAGNQPGTLLENTLCSAKVLLKPGAGLRYSIFLKVEEGKSRLQLEYELENVSDKKRQISCWSIICYGRNGKILVPFGKKSGNRRRLVLPCWSAWPQPGVRVGHDSMTVDPLAKYEGEAFKVGVITACGWVAFLRCDQALVSWSFFSPDAIYPEDGANIAIFVGEPNSETEQMSPLQEVGPGEKIRHSETLEWLKLPFPSPDDPDVLRRQIEAKLKL